MVPYTVFGSAVLALFLAIIGVYAYVHSEVRKSRKEFTKALKEIERNRKEQTDRLANHIGTLEVALTNRLTAIETRLKLNSRSSPK